MTYRGVTYNIPIDIFLPPSYPLRPPTVFVRPVSSMAIRENHRHVGLDGQVYLPYLHEWRPNTHELCELAVWMSSTFGSDPPCYAKPTKSSVTSSGTGSSSSYTNNSSTSISDDQKRLALEKEIAEANMAADAARRAAAEEARLEQEAKQFKMKHDEQLLNIRAMAASKAHFRLQQLFNEARVELKRELKDQKLLESGKEKIESLLRDGEQKKALLIKENASLDEAITSLEIWIAAIEEHKKKCEEEKASLDNGERIDLLTIPADTHSAQMLALSAENAAIDDCIYFLDRALVKGSIPLDVFLKEVRKLSKRQFMAKVSHLPVGVFT